MAESEGVFLDTNILVYATVSEATQHVAAHNAVRKKEEAGAEFWISRQVLREYLAVMTRPQMFTVPPKAVIFRQLRQFERLFHVVDDTADVTARLLDLTDSVDFGGKQVHDANIVATMLTHSIPTLLTANVSHFERFADYIRIETI